MKTSDTRRDPTNRRSQTPSERQLSTQSRWGGWLPLPASKRQGGGCHANHEHWEPPVMDITTIGLDLAKNVFQVHAINSAGEVVVRRALRRAQMTPFFSR